MMAAQFLEGCHPYICGASVWHVLSSFGAKRKYLIFICLPKTWNDEEYWSLRKHDCKNGIFKWNFSTTPPPWQGKTRTMWRGAFFTKICPTLRKKNKFSHTLLKDMLYTALSPDQPPQSDLLHPPPQMGLALDMSYLLAFSHLTPTDQWNKSSSLWNSFVHLLTSLLRSFLYFLFISFTLSPFFLPVFLCIGTHITGRIVFPIHIQFSISPPLPTVLSQ